MPRGIDSCFKHARADVTINEALEKNIREAIDEHDGDIEKAFDTLQAENDEQSARLLRSLGMEVPEAEVELREVFGGRTLAGGNKSLTGRRAARTLHMKDAESFHAVQEQFGSTDIPMIMDRLIHTAARDMGIAEKFGINYEHNIVTVLNHLEDAADGPTKARLQDIKRKQLPRMLDAIDGSNLIPEDKTAAKVFSAVRSLISMAKLGGAFVSAITDSANIAAQLSDLRGGVGPKGYGEYLRQVLTLPFGGKQELDKFLTSIGVSLDVMRATMFDEFAAQGLEGGLISRGNALYGKVSGITPMANAAKRAAGVQIVQTMGDAADTSWDNLYVGLRDAMELAGIDEASWDAMRKQVQDLEVGEYKLRALEPSAMRGMEDADVDGYLAKRGLELTDFARDQARRELDGRLRSFYHDTILSAAIESKPETRVKMGQNQRPGSWPHTMLSFFFQFKSFPIAQGRQRIWRKLRMAKGSAIDGRMDVLKDMSAWKSAAVPLAAYMVQATMMGYAAMSIKDMMKGRNPRRLDDPRSWVAAAQQGGAVSIYGDFLFGDLKNRFGGGPITTFMGPWTGPATDILNLIGQIKEGDTDVGPDAFRALLRNIPNTAYTKMLMDYMFLNELTEWMSPGSTERRWKRIYKETGQTQLDWSNMGID